ncbi:MAG: endonuclease III [Parachlamydiaceae bacterium]|nr:endonuclease III [Parachlamydiaceae bacterium]
MNKRQRASKIHKILEQLYPSPAIPLLHSDSYTLLIAVLLSAQCTDARVNTITPKLFAKANTPSKMIQLSIKEIEEIIRPCGLAPKKAKAIWELSHIILNKHNGMVPNSFEDLEELPGVGHKTASVVMSQAFNQPAFPIDTHIHRCAKRWGLSNGKNVTQTELDLKSLFPKKNWNLLHLRIIYFAREHCPSRNHQASECPICSLFVF